MKRAFPRIEAAHTDQPRMTTPRPLLPWRLLLLLLLTFGLFCWPGTATALWAQDEEPPVTEETTPTEGEPTEGQPTEGESTEAGEPPANPLVTHLEELGGYPCPLPDFGPGVEVEPLLDPATGEPSEEPLLTCVTLTVPFDHANPDDEQTLDVVFGVKPAPGRSRGMLVIAVGGPGGAGIEAGYFYLTSARFGELLPEEMDLVFFDQRGVGLSHPLDCPAAVNEYYEATWNDNP